MTAFEQGGPKQEPKLELSIREADCTIEHGRMQYDVHLWHCSQDELDGTVTGFLSMLDERLQPVPKVGYQLQFEAKDSFGFDDALFLNFYF